MKRMAGALGVMKEKKTPKRRAFIGLLVLLMVASTLMTGCGTARRNLLHRRKLPM